MSSLIFEDLVKMDPSVGWGAGVNGCLQSLKAPFVAGAEPSVVSTSGAKMEVMHQLMGKTQQWEESCETCGKLAQEGGQEGEECEDGGGDSGKGIGGMVVSIALET